MEEKLEELELTNIEGQKFDKNCDVIFKDEEGEDYKHPYEHSESNGLYVGKKNYRDVDYRKGVKEKIKKGNKYFQKKDYPKAIKYYSKLNFNDVSGGLMGYSDVVNECRKAKDNFVCSYIRLGYKYLKEGKYLEAMECFLRANELENGVGDELLEKLYNELLNNKSTIRNNINNHTTSVEDEKKRAFYLYYELGKYYLNKVKSNNISNKEKYAEKSKYFFMKASNYGFNIDLFNNLLYLGDFFSNKSKKINDTNADNMRECYEKAIAIYEKNEERINEKTIDKKKNGTLLSDNDIKRNLKDRILIAEMEVANYYYKNGNNDLAIEKYSSIKAKTQNINYCDIHNLHEYPLYMLGELYYRGYYDVNDLHKYSSYMLGELYNKAFYNCSNKEDVEEYAHKMIKMYKEGGVNGYYKLGLISLKGYNIVIPYAKCNLNIKQNLTEAKKYIRKTISCYNEEGKISKIVEILSDIKDYAYSSISNKNELTALYNELIEENSHLFDRYQSNNNKESNAPAYKTYNQNLPNTLNKEIIRAKTINSYRINGNNNKRNKKRLKKSVRTLRRQHSKLKSINLINTKHYIFRDIGGSLEYEEAYEEAIEGRINGIFFFKKNGLAYNTIKRFFPNYHFKEVSKPKEGISINLNLGDKKEFAEKNTALLSLAAKSDSLCDFIIATNTNNGEIYKIFSIIDKAKEQKIRNEKYYTNIGNKNTSAEEYLREIEKNKEKFYKEALTKKDLNHNDIFLLDNLFSKMLENISKNKKIGGINLNKFPNTKIKNFSRWDCVMREFMSLYNNKLSESYSDFENKRSITHTRKSK